MRGARSGVFSKSVRRFQANESASEGPRLGIWSHFLIPEENIGSRQPTVR